MSSTEQPLFINEYTYTDQLITRFSRLQASGRRRGILLLCGCTLIAVGAVWLFTPQSLHWLGLAPMALGAFCLWHRTNMYRIAARRAIARMQEDEADTGRFRRVRVFADRLTLSLADGRTQVYPFDELTDFQMDDRIFAVVFGRHGIAVPKDTFVLGEAEAFGSFLTARLYPAGSRGPDTPNR